MKSRKLTYYAPVKVKFTARQMEEIVRENMDAWGLERDAAEECCDEDVFLAASRLGYVSIPAGSQFDNGDEA